MPAIRVKENEPFEVAHASFQTCRRKTGLLTELRAREAYENQLPNCKRKSCCSRTSAKRLRSQQLPPKMYQLQACLR